MNNPKVSVIIPAYNQSEYLGEALQSVFQQSYLNFEVIVVNDASPDDTNTVVKQFNDPRLVYIVHKENRGLPAARNTGILASSGEIIALLDCDDYFHKEKLQSHVIFLNNNPEVGASYNARFNLNSSAKTLRNMNRPPLSLSLSDLVLGFPFAPSDMVIRREWLDRVNLFDESYKHFSEDLDINCRLALAGCQFMGVDRALNYRRLHSNRWIRNIPERLGAAIRALEKTFADPRCPEEVIALRNRALANNYLVWSYQSYKQNIIPQGQQYLREAVLLSPSIIAGKICEYVTFLSENSVADLNEDHEDILSKVASNLPVEFRQLLYQFDSAVARGYLMKAVREIIWEYGDGKLYLIKAAQVKVPFDEGILLKVNRELLDYYMEFGFDAVKKVIRDIGQGFEMIGRKDDFRFIQYCFLNDRAFTYYKLKNYSEVVRVIWRDFFGEKIILNNKGLLSIFVRSLAIILLYGPKSFFSKRFKPGSEIEI
jgi:glycosyltransferase involved in cell wall biosynthesis